MAKSPEQIRTELQVLRCRQGDRAAFEDLIATWQPRLWRHARNVTGRDDAAWDVVQEVWMAAVKGIGRLADEVTFPRWIFRILAHKCADWARSEQKGRTAALAAEEVPDEAEAGAGEQTDAVRAALAVLDPDRRQILSLHYAEGMAIAEIALVLDVPEGTVKSRLYHAQRQLREIMEAQGDDGRLQR